MKRFTALGFAAALSFGLPAYAVEYSVVGLGFEGMQVQTDGVYESAQVWEFYEGGFSRSDPPPPPPVVEPVNLIQGPDYKVVFNDKAIVYRSILEGNGTGLFGPRYENQPSGPLLTGLGVAAMAFREAAPILNYAPGFGTGFSFYYASQGPVTVTIYDDVGGGGKVLNSLTFIRTPTCSEDPDNTNCAWAKGSLAFSGTARSVKLAGVASQTLFDNVTFGSLTPQDGVTPVPEPGTYALMGLGLVAIGWAARRRSANSQGSLCV